MYSTTMDAQHDPPRLAKFGQEIERQFRKFVAKRMLPCETPWHLRKHANGVAPKLSKAKTPEDKSPFANPRNFGEALRKKGFECLGCGAYSEVYGKPGSEKVIKLIRRPDEDSWIDYMHWSAKAGYAGSFAPKVTSYKYITAPWQATTRKDFAVAVVERLLPLKDQDMKFLARTVDHAANNGGKIAGEMVDKYNPGMLKFIEDLGKEFPKNMLDMHGGNFMLRKDGTFVVTDPLAGKMQREKKRLKAGDLTPLPTVH